jgi:transcription elongation factor S-II
MDEIIKISSKKRNKTIKKFQNHLKLKVATNLEKKINKFSKNYCRNRNITFELRETIYNDKVINLLDYLKQNEIDTKKESLGILVNSSVDKLYPKIYKEIKKRKKYKEDKLKNQAFTNAFPCRRCGAKKATFYQMQTRSADEPMTTFIKCLNCGNKWKS